MNNDRDLKNVLTLSREIRIRMIDASVIYATVVDDPHTEADESFRVKPWGRSETMVIRFSDVSSARPVSRMGWHAQRAIAAAQGAARAAPVLPAD
jgi:hypothetical protein